MTLRNLLFKKKITCLYWEVSPICEHRRHYDWKHLGIYEGDSIVHLCGLNKWMPEFQEVNICPNYGPTIKTLVEHIAPGLILTRATRPSIAGPLGVLLSPILLILKEQLPPGTLHLPWSWGEIMLCFHQKGTCLCSHFIGQSTSHGLALL